MKICDLHTHSCFSDGTFTPTELVEQAKKVGLSAIALTDHNNLGGVAEFLAHAKTLGIEGVAGVEFSTDYKDKELHILGLFIKEEYFKAVETICDEVRKNKEKSNRKMIENLNKLGYDLSYDEIKLSCKGTMNRAHIGEALFKKGYISDIKGVFSTLLSKDGNVYVPAKRIDVFKAITFIKSIGAVAVLAHPFLDLDETELKEFLSKAVPLGLDGMETVYSEFSAEQTAVLKQIAKEYGIKESGGSDFHGYRKKDISLAIGKGNLQIPYEFYLNLKP
ncbi:MAG: PHP domain-containing protein [Clostridia bacterium]|nr:PHP domain-containing protein [Clostridia bacterium]